MDLKLLEKMFEVILLCLCWWNLVGVFGTESVSVTEGYSVSLYMNVTETQRKEGIMWKFGPQEITIAGIEVGGNDITLYEKSANGRFRDRLQLNRHTGSLTINNIRITDSGDYKVISTSTNTQLKIFSITVYGVFGTESVSVTEGYSVSLYMNVTETQRKEGIMWKFGPQEITIAEIEVGGNDITLYEKSANGRFRDRLQLNRHTGSLTINNIRITDSGDYKVISTSTNTQLNIFNITVYEF